MANQSRGEQPTKKKKMRTSERTRAQKIIAGRNDSGSSTLPSTASCLFDEKIIFMILDARALSVVAWVQLWFYAKFTV